MLSEADLEALLSDPRAEDVAAAEAAVLSAQLYLDDVLAGPSEQDVAESEANVRAQEANLATASAAYQSTLDSISELTIAEAEADLVDAQIAYEEARETDLDFPWVTTHDAFLQAAEDLAIAQTALDEVLAGPSEGTIGSAAASASAAAANLDEAEADHALLLAGASESEVAAAEASLAQAKADLANLTAAASVQAIAVAEAEAEQARLALADARDALAEATIIAPSDAVVAALHVAEGEYASGEVAELVSNDLNVVLNVDEVDVGLLSVGQPALVTLEAWPDAEIAAEIASIAPSATDSDDGIVSFDVTLRLEDTDLPILVGMTADARLITAEHDNVLLVPNAAIMADRQAGTYTVNLVTGESNEERVIEQVPVTVGLRDDDYTEITGGLDEGDRVALSELETSTGGFGPFGG
jgi:HlyD family secretion protein